MKPLENTLYAFHHYVTEDELSEDENNKIIHTAKQLSKNSLSRKRTMDYDPVEFDEKGALENPTHIEMTAVESACSYLLPQMLETAKLANLFYSLIDNTFENLELDNPMHRIQPLQKTPRERYWTFITNKNEKWNEWHSHVTHGTINCVYYPQLFDPSAIISIVDIDGEVKQVNIKDRSMLIIPGWMLHKPHELTIEDGYRISVNIHYWSLRRPIVNIKKYTDLEYSFGHSYHDKYVPW